MFLASVRLLCARSEVQILWPRTYNLVLDGALLCTQQNKRWIRSWKPFVALCLVVASVLQGAINLQKKQKKQQYIIALNNKMISTRSTIDTAAPSRITTPSGADFQGRFYHNTVLTLRLRWIFWNWSKFWRKFLLNNRTFNGISGDSNSPHKTMMPSMERKFMS